MAKPTTNYQQPTNNGRTNSQLSTNNYQRLLVRGYKLAVGNYKLLVGRCKLLVGNCNLAVDSWRLIVRSCHRLVNRFKSVIRRLVVRSCRLVVGNYKLLVNRCKLLVRSCRLVVDPRSFTLVELLVVIALIAVLAVAVILSLNPSELLKQGRDSTRLSDLQNLNRSLSWFNADTGGTGFMGSSSVIYVSVPDTSPTCSNLGLPTPPPGWSYHCVTQENLQKTDGSGWIPVNFNQISFGRTLTKLPIDPKNQTSTGNYYTYVAGGSWELTTLLESEKYSPQAINDGDAFPGVYSLRTSPNPLTPGLRDKGMVGYWSFDEGSGTTAYDRSGNNNNGTLYNGPTWVDGKVGKALSFDGVNDYVDVGNSSTLVSKDMSILMWVQVLNYNCNSTYREIIRRENANGYQWSCAGMGYWDIGYKNNNGIWNSPPGITSSTIPLNQWTFIASIYDSNSVAQQRVFINGNKYSESTLSDRGTLNSNITYIGSYGPNNRPYSGLIDEVRIYNRALSDAEIQAIYNATK